MAKSTGCSGFKSPQDKKKNKIQEQQTSVCEDCGAGRGACGVRQIRVPPREPVPGRSRMPSALHVGLPLAPSHTKDEYLKLKIPRNMLRYTLRAAPTTSPLNTVTLYLADFPVVCAARAVPGPGRSCSSCLGAWRGTPFRPQRGNATPTPTPTEAPPPAQRETTRCLCFASP